GEDNLPAPEEVDPTPGLVLEKLEDGQELPEWLAGPPRRRTWLGLPKPLPFVPQAGEADCGAASLALVARYHREPGALAPLRDRAHVGPEGASMLGLTKAAEALGFRWRAVTADFERIAGLSLPAVAHWEGRHYLVLYAAAGGRVVLGDPAGG